VTARSADQESARGPRAKPGRHRAHARKQSGLGGRVRSLVGESLIKNAASLGTNVLLGAVTGAATLAELTRLYPVRAIGLSAAAIAGTSLITSISQLGLNYSLVRFLPTSRMRQDLINSVLTATAAVSLIAGAVFLVLPDAGKLYALGGLAFIPLFLISTCFLTEVGQIQNVFIADRKAGKTVQATLVDSLVRLAAPAIFLFAGLSGAYLAQGVLPTAVTFVVLVVLLRRRGHRFRPKLSLSATRELLRFSAGTYLAGLIGGLPAIALPLIILSRFGASQNAYWYTAIAAASVLFSIPSAVTNALLAEAAHRPEARRSLVRRSVLVIVAVMVPVIVCAYFGAPLALAILGHRYAVEGLTVLRWLIIAAAMTSVNYVAGTILYLAKKALVIACINAADAIVVVGLSVTWARSVDQVGIAWVIGEVGNVVLFSVFAVVALVQVGWHWERLGGDGVRTGKPATAAEPAYRSSESQLAGLEMLLSLATHQVRPILGPSRTRDDYRDPSGGSA
jgi:O-antigen/teichoic acid export membrane protein